MSETESVSSGGVLGDRQVNSPALMNPKKPIQHAAQSMTLLNVTGYWDQTVCTVLRMAGVMGSLLARGLLGILLRIPFKR